jgi:hypothetical protein
MALKEAPRLGETNLSGYDQGLQKAMGQGWFGGMTDVFRDLAESGRRTALLRSHDTCTPDRFELLLAAEPDAKQEESLYPFPFNGIEDRVSVQVLLVATPTGISILRSNRGRFETCEVPEGSNKQEFIRECLDKAIPCYHNGPESTTFSWYEKTNQKWGKVLDTDDMQGSDTGRFIRWLLTNASRLVV